MYPLREAGCNWLFDIGFSCDALLRPGEYVKIKGKTFELLSQFGFNDRMVILLQDY